MSKRIAIASTLSLIACLLALPAPSVTAQRRNIGGPADYFLREKLAGRFARDPQLTQEQLTVVMVNGGAVLSGPISNCNLQLRALSSAAVTLGIINVTDLLEVTRGKHSDKALRDAVLSILSDPNSGFDISSLEVQVEDSVATLRGGVRDFYLRIKAEEAAGTVFGVTRIVNLLQPADAPSGDDDASLTSALIDYLGDPSQFPYAAILQVKVIDGVAHLSGRSRLFLAVRHGLMMSRLVVGIRDVESQIRVDPSLNVMRVRVEQAD